MNEASATTDVEQSFTTRQILKLVPDLDRDLLYFWEKKGWLGESDPNIKPEGKARKRRIYSRRQLDKIRILFRSYQAGYRPETAGDIARGSALLADPRLYEKTIKATTEIMSSVVLHDLDKTLAIAVEQFQAVVNVDTVTVFLIERGEHMSDLRVRATTDRRGIRSVEPVATSNEAIQQRKTIRLDPPDFLNAQHSEDLTDSNRVYLSSSVLSVPLLARKNAPIGVIQLTNRRLEGGQRLTAFDAQDQAVCEMLAAQMSQCIQAVRVFETQKDVIIRLERGDSHSDILNWLLMRVLLILPAERADICVREVGGDGVIVLASRGPGDISAEQNMPEKSIGYLMCNRRLPTRIVRRVTPALDGYLWVWNKARSVISVAFEFPIPESGRLAALTAESSHPDAFDVDYHGDILERLTTSVALADAFVRQGLDSRLELARQLIKDVLATIKEGPGMDAAIVYQLEPFPWDQFDRDPHQLSRVQREYPPQLHCVAAAGHLANANRAADFRYSFDKPSFARRIFETSSPQYSAIPEIDPSVCSEGLAWFDIHGPLIGAPMIHKNVVVGALVCWSREARAPVESDKYKLVAYANLLASSLFLSESAAKYRSKRLHEVKEVLMQMQAERTPDRTIRIILEALKTAGFDRTRAFRYIPEHHVFKPLMSVGMKGEDKFLRGVIHIQESYYARRTFAEWQSCKVASRIYPVEGQVDPYEERFDKLRGWPWAQVPLVIHDRLYGYLAADNHIERRPITQDMLDFMTIVGVIAAQTLENSLRTSESENAVRPLFQQGTVKGRVSRLRPRTNWQSPNQGV